MTGGQSFLGILKWGITHSCDNGTRTFTTGLSSDVIKACGKLLKNLVECSVIKMFGYGCNSLGSNVISDNTDQVIHFGKS